MPTPRLVHEAPSVPAARVLAVTLGLGLLPSLGCAVEPEPEPAEPDPDPGIEEPGEPLAQRSFCENGEPIEPREFANANLAALGACGDALLWMDGGPTLVPVDGEPEALESNSPWTQFSPRGRLLAVHDWSEGNVQLRDLDAGTTLDFDGEDIEFGFVISKQRPGARLWLCDGGQLDVIVGEERVELAGGVICSSIASSPMHSQMVFATNDGAIWWADTDEPRVSATGLAGFEYDPSDVIGVRRDSLRMAPSGAYLLYHASTLELGDDTQVVPFATTALDLASDQVLLDNDSGGLLIGQAPLFEAPLVLGKWLDTNEIELFAVQDAVAHALASDVQQFEAGLDSVLVLSSAGEVRRHGGEDFSEVETELSTSSGMPGSGFIFTSVAGAAGYLIESSDICATPECMDYLRSLRGFGGETTGQQLLSRDLWKQIHVSEDGTLVTDGIVVEDTVDDWGSFPYPRLLVLAPDASIAAQWEHNPNLTMTGFARIEGDRIAVAYSDGLRPDVVMIVDPNAGTITEGESYADDDGDIHSIESDASGQVLVLQISNRIRITAL